jgi:hypothetical protein
MPLDPIVSLSVALAEAPGSCALFLGSGVSRDAGVPTGAEVMRQGLGRLYELETQEAPPDEETLAAWLAETGREGITYSQLLEEIAPDPAIRREYLAGFFEGIEPGPTHETLAGMAERGLVRVFVTTNFDRLLENALRARGIEPVVIASDADLAVGVPREHAACYVLKPHGDYLMQTIRNTPEELAQLEPAMTAELGEVFNRYGIVVLGYSGSDEAIAELLRDRRSRYGVWWVARGGLGTHAAQLVEATGGRVIRRDTAAEMLADLEQRLRVFEEHPTGLTPGIVHDATLALVRAGDAVGLEEALRRERNAYDAEIPVIRERMVGRHPNAQGVGSELWAIMRPVLERRLASMMPLGMYAPERLAIEAAEMAVALEREPRIGGFDAWSQIRWFGATWIGYTAGAILLRLNRIEALSPLLTQNWMTEYRGTEPLLWLPSATGDVLAQELAPEGNWLSPLWEFVAQTPRDLDWLTERYPELGDAEETRALLGEFDLLRAIALGLHDHRAAAFFTLGSAGAYRLARRLHHDGDLRARVAEACAVGLDVFDARAAQAIRDAWPFQGGFTATPEMVARVFEQGAIQ